MTLSFGVATAVEGGTHAPNAQNTPFNRRRGLLDTDFLALLAHVLLGTLLSKVVPFLYGAKPALLQLGAGLPYSKVG